MRFITVSTTGSDVVGKHYVGSTGDNIQRAIDYLKDSGEEGIVFIEKGTYTCTVAIRLYSNVEICGEGVHTFITRTDGGTASFPLLEAVGSADAKLENIYIHDLLLGGSVALANTGAISISNVGQAKSGELEYKKGVTISACTIKYCSNTLAINISDSSNCLVERNKVSYCNGGISIATTTQSVIKENKFFAINLDGILSPNGLENVEILSNSFHRCLGNGIYLSYCKNITVKINVIASCSISGIRMVASNYCNIVGNSVQNCKLAGIIVTHISEGVGLCFYNNISGNYCYGNGTTGIYVMGGKFNNVVANGTYHNASYGISCEGLQDDNHLISGNNSAYNVTQDIVLYAVKANVITGNRVSKAVKTLSSTTTGKNESNLVVT